jgi:CBS-domain-containing membrane protein
MKRESGPKSYGSFADFEREELRPMNKVGFTVDDLEAEAGFKSYDEHVENDREELDFG